MMSVVEVVRRALPRMEEKTVQVLAEFLKLSRREIERIFEEVKRNRNIVEGIYDLAGFRNLEETIAREENVFQLYYDLFKSIIAAYAGLACAAALKCRELTTAELVDLTESVHEGLVEVLRKSVEEVYG